MSPIKKNNAFLSLFSTRSIAYGVIAGIISYVLINGLAWLLSRVSSGRLAPPNYDQSEPWVIPPGSIIPAWMCVVLPYLDLPYDFDPDTNTRRRFIAGRAGFIDEPADMPMEMHQQRPASMASSSAEHDKRTPDQTTEPVYDSKIE